MAWEDRLSSSTEVGRGRSAHLSSRGACLNLKCEREKLSNGHLSMTFDFWWHSHHLPHPTSRFISRADAALTFHFLLFTLPSSKVQSALSERHRERRLPTKRRLQAINRTMSANNHAKTDGQNTQHVLSKCDLNFAR